MGYNSNNFLYFIFDSNYSNIEAFVVKDFTINKKSNNRNRLFQYCFIMVSRICFVFYCSFQNFTYGNIKGVNNPVYVFDNYNQWWIQVIKTPCFEIKEIEGFSKGERRLKIKVKIIPCEIYSRVVGYFRPIECWNKGKLEEFHHRKFIDPKSVLEKEKPSTD